MPPKSPKSSAGAKDKKGAVQRTDFSIIFLNAEDATLDPLLYQNYREALLRKRRPIFAISQETITEVILSEKENVEIKRAKELLLAGMSPPAEVLLLIVKQRIAEYQAENDRILEIQEKLSIFDVLQFWKDNGDSETIPQNTKSKGKDKPKAKPPAKGKGGPQKPPPLKKVQLPEYVLKDWCALSFRGQNSNKKVYIEDSPIDGPKLFVLLFGIYDMGLFRALVQSGYPVSVVLRFAPSIATEEPTPKHADFWTEFERIRVEDIYKQIALYTIVTPCHPTKFLVSNIEQISTEVSYLVYDSVDWKRQQQHYFNNMNEYNVAESKPCLQLLDSELYGNYFDDMNVEDMTIEHVLDALLLRVEGLSPKKLGPLKANTSEVTLNELGYLDAFNEPNPFSCPADNKIILEHNDHLLKSLKYDVEGDLSQYVFKMNSYRDGYQLDRFLPELQQIDCHVPLECKEANSNYLNLEYFLNVLFAKGVRPYADENLPEAIQLSNWAKEASVRKVDFTVYVELYSPQVLQQQLVDCLKSFDVCVQEFNPITSSMIIRFRNNEPGMTHDSCEQFLTSKVCFRDFIEYVKNAEQDWLTAQERLYEQTAGTTLAGGPASVGYVDGIGYVEPKDFMINRSMKKHGNAGFVGDSTPPSATVKTIEIVEPIVVAKDSKKSPKSPKSPKEKGKSKSTIAAKTAQVADGAIDALKPFTGYNVDDRRIQVRSESVVYQSAICSIRLNRDKWLYRESLLNVSVVVNRVSLVFGQKFTCDDLPMRNINTMHLMSEDGNSLTLEVVVQDTLRRPTVRPASFQSQVSTFNVDPRQLVLRITRPNGLVVTTLVDYVDYMVEQLWVKPRYDERMRVIYHNGCVVVYQASGKIVLLTANGMKAETGLDQEFDLDAEAVQKKKQRPSEESVQSKQIEPQQLHEDSINTVLTCLPNPENQYFKMTTSTGKVFIVKDGLIVKELKSLYMREFYNYAACELSVRREDGLNLLYQIDQTKCSYPDSTVILTTYFQRTIPTPSENGSAERLKSKSGEEKPLRSQSTSFRTVKSTNTSSQSHNTAAYDTYQNQERSFTVTHDRYEPVTFDNQNGLLLFPNKNIEYCRQQIVANIKPSVHLVCGIEGLELTGTQCEMHDKRSITKVWFNCSEDFILQNDDGFLSVFSIDQTGHCELDSPDEQPVIDESVLCPCSLSKLGSLIGSAYSVNGQTLIRCPCSRSTEGSLKSKSLSADVVTCPCVSMKPKADEVICPCDVRNFERQFVVKQNWIGYEIKTSNEVFHLTDDEMNGGQIVSRRDGTITTLLPISVDTTTEEDIPDRGPPDVKCCGSAEDVPSLSTGHIPEKMTLRHFVKVVSHSEADVKNIALALVDPTQSISRRLRAENNVSIKTMLCEAANKSFSWYVAHEEIENIAEKIPEKLVSKAYPERLTTIKTEVNKTELYRRILKYKYKVIFHKFDSANLHVRNLPVDEIMEDIDEWLDEHPEKKKHKKSVMYTE